MKDDLKEDILILVIIIIAIVTTFIFAKMAMDLICYIVDAIYNVFKLFA